MLLLFAIALPLLADSSPPLFQSSTKLVQVTVFATGHRSIPISSLNRASFHLFEEGRARDIATFQSDSAGLAPAATASPPLFGAWSNHSAPASRGSLNVILIDLQDSNFQDWAIGSPQLIRTLRAMQSSQPLAIYVLGFSSGLRVLDADLGSLQRLDRSALPPSAETADAPHPSFSARGDGEIPELIPTEAVRSSAAALEALDLHMAGFPGRKSLIWIASRFPRPFDAHPSPSGYNPSSEFYRLRLLRAVNRLIASNVAIYPIDLRGLTPGINGDITQELIDLGPVAPMTDISPGLELAAHSGGKAYFNTNGLAQSLKDAVFSAQNSYTLGFYTSAKLDDRYHKIKVTVDTPGVHLRYRPGYWALSERASGTLGVEEDLKAAADSPFTNAAIQLEASMPPQAWTTSNATITLWVNPANLRLVHTGRRWTGKVDIFFGQAEGSGRVFGVPPYRAAANLPDEAMASHQWFVFQANLAIRAQSRFLRIVVRDQASGSVGSLDIPRT